MRADRLRPP